MKLRSVFSCILIAALLAAAMVVPAGAVDGSSQSADPLDAQTSIHGSGQLLDTAKSVILYEMETDTLVYSWNPDQRLDPSGMNKIMTALLAIELADPDAMVTVSRKALDSVQIGSVSAGLKAGEEISVKDLLYCMMVGSANDASAVIAEHIAGSQEDFVDLMNQRAKDLGCTDTNFMNSNGLSHDQQYSTARDLAKITLAALEDPFFRELFSAVSYTVPATNKSEPRELVTTNFLMSKDTVRDQYDERVTGGKTGALSTTDRSLIATAEVDGVRYLSVVMSAQGTVTADGLSVKTFGSFEETRALLDYGFEDYAPRQLLYPEQVMDQVPVTDGENDVIVCPAAELTVMLPVDMAGVDVSYKLQLPEGGLTAPLEQGATVGTIQVWFRGQCVGQSDMVATYQVPLAGTRNIPLTPTGEEEAKYAWTTWLLIGGIVVLGLLLGAGLVLVIRHKIREAKIRRRHKLIRGNVRRGERHGVE